VIVAVVHAHVNKDATFRFDTVGITEVTGFKNEKLQLLDMETMSPAIVGSLATLKAAFSQMFGKFGKGIQWFVYANGSVTVAWLCNSKMKNTPTPRLFLVARRHSRF
jgi:hypothetical protein